jgi:hypothetical protein
MKTFISIVFPFVLFSGCTITDNSFSANKPIDYTVEQSISCFCPQSGELVKLFVVNDTIADAVWLSNNNHLNIVERCRFRSIKGLFTEIERWDSSASFQVSVTYDPMNHYPSRVSIIPRPIIENDSVHGIILDAGISYTTWNYIKIQ